MSRADQQAQTRTALITAGATLFARRGYHGTKIDEIARKAGFTRGAFYANFRDKGDLFLSILEQQRERDMGRLADTLDDTPGADIPTRIAEWMDKTLVSGKLRRAMAEFALVAETSPPHRRRLAANLRAIRDATATMIEHCRHRHLIYLTVDDTTFATMITALVGGTADIMRLEPDAASSKTVSLAIAALWDGLQQEHN